MSNSISDLSYKVFEIDEHYYRIKLLCKVYRKKHRIHFEHKKYSTKSMISF